MSKYYVAYGSNLNLDQMAYRCPTARVVGKGVIENYELVFWGVATILKKKRAKVPVAVWEIDDKCEFSLDIYEGYTQDGNGLYRKEVVPVKMYDGSVINGMVYIMNHRRRRDNNDLPTKYYYDTILRGYEDVGLDKRYLVDALERCFKAVKKCVRSDAVY